MNIGENVLMAISSLRSNKMRALLTMLGIIIGIASVIAIMTVGNSLTGSLTESMQSFGVGNITVSLQSTRASGRGGVGMNIAPSNLMTDAMIDDLTAEYPDEIDVISLSEQVGSGQTVNGRKYANLSLMGVNVGYFTANSIELESGRLITQRDIDNKKNGAVVSSLLAENMFGEEDPIGQTIVINTNSYVDRFTIVGVYTYEASTMGISTSNSADVSTTVYIPLSIAQKVSDAAGYTNFTVVTKAGVNATEFTDKITTFMNRYYSRNDNFEVSAYSMESMVESVTEMLTTVSMAIAAIAAISLLVGGIGVMNIMMVSITERTREIGTRKAIGATNGEIRLQFIVEAIVICLVGGIIGIILGITLGSVAANYLGYSARPSVSVMLLAAGFSMVIGVFFGYYPANKAAKMDPIEALRYE